MSEEPALSYDEDADMEESIYEDHGGTQRKWLVVILKLIVNLSNRT